MTPDELVREVLKAQERAEAAAHDLRDFMAAMREGRRLPRSGPPPSWQDIKERIAKLTENNSELMDEIRRQVDELESGS